MAQGLGLQLSSSRSHGGVTGLTSRSTTSRRAAVLSLSETPLLTSFSFLLRAATYEFCGDTRHHKQAVHEESVNQPGCIAQAASSASYSSNSLKQLQRQKLRVEKRLAMGAARPTLGCNRNQVPTSGSFQACRYVPEGTTSAARLSILASLVQAWQARNPGAAGTQGQGTDPAALRLHPTPYSLSNNFKLSRPSYICCFKSSAPR